MNVRRRLAAMMLAALLIACAQMQALGQQPQEPRLQPSEVEEVKRLMGEVQRLGAEGRNLEGAEVFERVVALMTKGFGPEHPNLAVLIGQLGGVYYKLGLHARAEAHYLRALAIREKAFGPEHILVAQSANDLALLYAAKGHYARAEPLLRRTLAIEEKLLGPAHPNVAAVLNNLGELYRYRADYAQAESLYLRALAIEEKALGVDNPTLASTLTNLGTVYYYKGDYARAEPLFLRGLAIVEKAKGPESPEVVVSLNNLGALYHNKGDVKRAEESYRRALSVEEKAYGPDKPEVAMMLNNLGELYRETEQYDLAAPMFERALAIREKTLGPDHPDTAEVLDNLSLLLQARGDYARAEALRRRALGIIEKIYGPQHPLVAGTLINFAALYNLKGDMARAVEFNERAAEINEHNLALVLSTGSEQQKQLYLDTLAGDTFGTVSLHVRNAPNDERAARLALTAILRRKGRSLDAMADQVGALRRRATPEDRSLLDQLAAARSSRAALQLSTEAAALAPAERQAREAQLSSEVERLEGEVSRRSAEFRAASRPVTFDAVRQAIPPDAALVEMFSYRPFDPRKELEKFGPARYVAYVVRRDSASPLWVELGEAAVIEADVVRLREALKDPARANVKDAARALDQRVMLPVRKLLGDVRRIFLSPDGALNLVPFAALVDESDRYLVENYSINYLTSGRDLLRLQVRADARGGAPPVVIANPTFDLAGTKAGAKADAPTQATAQTSMDAQTSAGEVGSGRRSGDLSQAVWPPLKGTADEAAALRTTLAGAQILTEGEATEAALKQVRHPRALHIATHGFFLPDQPEKLSAGARGIKLSGGGGSGGAGVAARRENPLLRSGLVLAGVNRKQSGEGEDGILTALEAAGLDLWGTRLVVLSACETGLGEVKNGAGVYGLRRALVLAGSETQLMSLWQVSDAGTRDLMTAYYARLEKGEGRTEALRQVQLAMLRGENLSAGGGQRGLAMSGATAKAKLSHPYFWAAFIPSGAWTNMDGQEAR